MLTKVLCYSIFFPAKYDQTSAEALPLLISIHGGGFCLGQARDIDAWNRTFSDKFQVLLVSLNYSKAPLAPFPTGLYDLEAVILAVLADESLPIDRSSYSSRQGLSRTAIAGFSAGGNLALAVSQLPSIRTHPLAPAAAVSVYGCVDLSVPPREKARNRPYKPTMGPPRGGPTDGLLRLCPTFDWSYIPYGHDLRDPLLSPAYARREDLPPFVCLVAAELDMIAHEGWRMACRLSHEGAGGAQGRRIPDRESEDPAERICGQEEVSDRLDTLQGAAQEDEDEDSAADERFGFEDAWARGGVKWLLVQDVMHGFDNAEVREATAMGDRETVRDAQVKTRLYMDELGSWLRSKVWGLQI